MERGKIYSFVGPAGGGKNYAAKEIIGESNYNEIPCISVDFSDGIREIISVMLSGKCEKIDINSEKYFNWKEENQTVKIPDGTLFCVNGRDMLKNLGEFLKERIGEEIWANWALNILMKKYYELDILSRNACNIIFGSLRFDVELKAILKCAEFTKKEVEIIFCNYNNIPFKNGYVHPSERLAQGLIKYGFKHRDIVTEYLI